MDIHKPKPWRGVREFLKEYVIIVIGVLTALAGEQFVERLEWAHKVRAAEDAMRAELLIDDGPQIYQRGALHDCRVARLDDIRAAVEAAAPRAEVVRRIDGYKVDPLTYDTLAHDEAIHSGVADHMSPTRRQLWTDAYSSLPSLDRASGEEAQALGRLRALGRSGGLLSEAERIHVLDAVEALRVEELRMLAGANWSLPAIYRIGRLDRRRVNELMDGARRAYGPACVVDFQPRNHPVARLAEARP
jgi:hypothetical protein